MSCSNLDPHALALYAVTDRRWLPEGASLEDQVRQAIEGGVSIVQLREKNLDEEDFLAEAKRIKTVCHELGVPFIVNDNVEVARLVGADGVHVGQSDMAAQDVRALLGPNMILGVSAHTVEEALAAEQQGADYLGVGAVFATGSKDDATAVSRETLAQICAAVQIPAVAIGGITRENLPSLTGTGIAGAAVISAIFAQSDVKQAARELRHCIDSMLTTPPARP